MIQSEEIIINAPIETVWNFIEDPNNLQLWNPKVKRVTAFSNSGKEVGTSFGILYLMSGKTSEMRGEVVIREPMVRLTFRYSGGQMGQDKYVEEGFELTPTTGGILLVQSINFTELEIPLWARIVMWFVFKTGKPVGESYLVTLKSLIEQS